MDTFFHHGSVFGPSPLSRPSVSPQHKPWKELGFRRHSPGDWEEHGGAHTPLSNPAGSSGTREGERDRLEQPSFVSSLPSSLKVGSLLANLSPRTAGVTTGLLKNSLQIIHTNLFKGANGFNY